MKKKQQHKQRKSMQFGVVALTTIVCAFVLAVVGMSTTMHQIDEIAVSKTPEAILASAGLTEQKKIYLPVMYYDQKSDECVNMYDSGGEQGLANRQFEWSTCGYYNKDIEQGLVKFELSDKYTPVATGSGNLIPNKGLTSFDGWFEAVEDKSMSYDGALKLEYQSDGAEFVFSNDNFYPLDKAEFSEGDAVNADGHNHLFTMSFAAPFTALNSGMERFGIAADDDTFVYVGDKLVIDLGGIHDVATGWFEINKDGEVYSAINNEDLTYTGVKVEKGEGSIIRIFHADRDSANSELDVRFSGLNLSVTSNASLANSDGVQIAYDPSDPSYVAPLGETATVKPDGTKGFIVIATIEGIMVIVFAVLMAAAIRSVVHRRLMAREEEGMTSQKIITQKK